MEYLGFNLVEPCKIECSKISRKEYMTRKAADYNGMTAPIKIDSTIYKSIITLKYYFEAQDKFYEIFCVTDVLIKSKTGRLTFNPANLEAIKCISEILTEVDRLINEFCSHFDEIKDKVKYLSTAEVYSLALVFLGGF